MPSPAVLRILKLASHLSQEELRHVVGLLHADLEPTADALRLRRTRANNGADASGGQTGDASGGQTGDASGGRVGESHNVVPNSVVASSNKNLRVDAIHVLHFLNEKTSRNYRDVDANLKLIEARLRSGASVQDCKSIIGRKVREWKDDAKMNVFLRPKTLFIPSNFEQYLGELGVSDAAGNV